MSQSDKAALYQALKAAGIQFTKHYRDYSTEELQQSYDQLVAAGVIEAPTFMVPQRQPLQHQVSRGPAAPPVAPRDPNEMAGARLNSQGEDEPIRTDPDTGRIIYQEEVLKPAVPKPRGRRVLTYLETGVETRTVVTGKESNGADVVETFEVAGRGTPRTAEVKVTLPSYQVGICKDPRLPFKIVTYNGREGFDFFEVCNYFGGPELVPSTCKRTYVENVLCYDIRSVVQEINRQYRQLQLAQQPLAQV